MLGIRRGIGSRLGVRQPEIILSRSPLFISLQAEVRFHHREPTRRASNLCHQKARILLPEATARSVRVQLVTRWVR